MKIALSKTFYLGLILLLCGLDSWAVAPNPPAPPQATPPPGGDIDSSIVFLIVAAIAYGAYVIIQKSKKQALISKNSHRN